MKPVAKFKWLVALFFIAVNAQSVLAQSKKADIFDEKVPITWLGVDYSQTKFIGSPTKGVSGNNGTVSNDEFRDVFILQWNYLFIDEMKKYDVAKAVHRASVKYAIDPVIKSNKALTTKDFFSANPSDFKLINEATIADAVKKYDFQNNEGIGMMFFVEGMDKGIASEGIWVTFVDMKSKTVLLTSYQTAKPGGFGFRNYWAKPLFMVLKEMDLNKLK
ncbi:MAG TPA: hypothetical protein VK671_05625 [Mucilaginibacter sp.]|jgi:hypothetical protein|nr:hypothetical protein [Mucilaginibacter sp.]